MTTQDPTLDVSTNGAAPPRAAPSFKNYPARSTAAIDPGAKGAIPYHLRRACRIVDVVGSQDVEIVAAAFGRRRIDLRKDGSRTVSEILATEPYEAAGGTSCVLTVRNKGAKAARLEVMLCVDNEHGPEVESRLLFRDGGSHGARAAEGNGRVKLSPSQPRSKNTPKSKPANEQARFRRPPPGESDKERAKKHVAKSAARADVITVPVIVQPPPESKVIVLYRSYAVMLHSFFKSCAPIGRQMRPVINHGLARAHRRAAGSAASLRLGEVAIVLPEADVERLYHAIQHHQEHRLFRSDGASDLRAAIKKALSTHPEGGVVSGSATGDIVDAVPTSLAAPALAHAIPPARNTPEGASVSSEDSERHVPRHIPQGVSSRDVSENKEGGAMLANVPETTAPDDGRLE